MIGYIGIGILCFEDAPSCVPLDKSYFSQKIPSVFTAKTIFIRGINMFLCILQANVKGIALPN